MNERRVRLICLLISRGKPVRILDLANILNLSSRTVRYDLDKIDDFLKANELPPLIRKPNSGIEYVSTDSQKQQIYSLLEGIGNYEYTLTPQERKRILLAELFQAKDYITIDDLANRIFVSRSTILNDLKGIQDWLSGRKLRLESLPHFGVRVKGCEKEVRKAVISFLSESIDMENALHLLKASVHMEIDVVAERQIKKLFEDIDSLPIEEAIGLAEQQLKITFSDNAFSSLVIHLALAVKRIQSGKIISMPEGELSKLRSAKEFAVASLMVAELGKRYGIEIPEDETGYITMHLLGGKGAAQDAFANRNWAELQVLADRLVKSVQKELKVDFSADEELYSGLIKHLEPAVYRLRHDLPLKNPILQKIKENYPAIFQVVGKSLKPLEEYAGAPIPDEETGFIVTHFGAAIERNNIALGTTYKAVVVCGTGVGTAKLLCERIKSKFANIEILGTVASRRICEFCSEKDLDLIITTVPVERTDVPHIEVGPLLLDDDAAKIYKFLNANLPKRSEGDKPLPILEDLLNIIEKNCTIKDRTILAKELSEFLKFKNHACLKGDIQPVLKDLLTEKTIKVNVEAKDWEDAIRIGGGMLAENGYVEERYVEAMIKNVRELGPYIVIAPGIAMPHARPEDGVREACMSLITLKEPVAFDNGESVRLLIGLGAVDHRTHLKALSELMRFLSDEACLNSLFKASTAAGAAGIIRNLSEPELSGTAG